MKIDTDEIKDQAQWAAAGAVGALIVATFVPALGVLAGVAALSGAAYAFNRYRQAKQAGVNTDCEQNKENQNGND